MINFDFYKYSDKAAEFIARNGICNRCPMYKECDASQVHGNTHRCFEMWKKFFEENPETLVSVDDFSGVLNNRIDCNKCPLKNDCDYSVTEDCGSVFGRWLRKETSTCQESRQVEEESDSVNHPDYYMLIDGIEVIDIINEILTRSAFTNIQGFYLGNVLKYILRADMKNGVEDLEKAEVYLNWLIESM